MALRFICTGRYIERPHVGAGEATQRVTPIVVDRGFFAVRDRKAVRPFGHEDLAATNSEPVCKIRIIGGWAHV